ncbi:MAG: DegT/DnrJ/EryC1/StrS family aminotransferase [Legionellaceae bacterium]|nr:DegT/DnrJ/EryC1/StrS family aminotransferase [Legionellaceae bacterium]
MQFIDLKTQYQLIADEVQAGIKKVLEHGQYIMGPEIGQLEEMLAAYVGVRHAIVNASGTDALLMALLALDIQPGDEVITTAFSFFATAEVIALINAKPVFVDIDPVTYNMDPAGLQQVITSKTKAIMPVSLYGQCADMHAINTIARQHGLAVIEDAAQSFGATYHGARSCSLSDIGCTSFFPSKPLGGYGDSGACFTNDDALAERLRQVRIHGQNGRYAHARIGINGRMDSIQAAIVIEKMKIFPREVALRQDVARRYHDLLSDVVKTPYVHHYNESVYAQYTIEVANRDEFQRLMQEQGIPTAVHYPSLLPQQAALQYLKDERCSHYPHAEKACQSVVSLPMHPYLTEAEQVKVAEAVKQSLRQSMAAEQKVLDV